MYGVDFGNIFHFTVSLHFHINTKDHRKTDGLFFIFNLTEKYRIKQFHEHI